MYTFFAAQTDPADSAQRRELRLAPPGGQDRERLGGKLESSRTSFRKNARHFSAKFRQNFGKISLVFGWIGADLCK